MLAIKIGDEHSHCFIAATSWQTIGVMLAIDDEDILIKNG